MTILFSMRHAGALRNFASTLQELARRGHHVRLTFLTYDKLADDRLLSELTTRYPAITDGGVTPVTGSRWLGLARSIRAVADYVRYETPDFAQAHALRARAELRVPARLRELLRRPLLRRPAVRRLVARLTAAMEQAIPADSAVIRAISESQPDVLLVTPLVEFGSDQIEYVKAARRLGIRSGLCVHSWDNLTTKGLIRVLPNRIFVWNDAQRREAITMHGGRPEQVAVTGAPVYDQWFDRRPSLSRDDFCARVGFADSRPFLLYHCSSPFIAPDEVSFVARWIAAVRSAADPEVRRAGILIRPHPSASPATWSRFDPSTFGQVVVWPAGGANPVDASSRNDYFDSMYHAAAAVGINTSAQIEAGIVGRRVYSVRVPECTGTQEDTLHFQYLLRESGGLLHMAETLDEHVAALGDALRPTGASADRLREFVRAFVRPAGLEVAATPQLVDAIEDLARLPADAPERLPLHTLALRLLLYPLTGFVHAKPPKPPSVPLRQGEDATRARDRRRAGAGA
jgi:hypothetical protein